MEFIDEIEFAVYAGNGGNGCVSFRREKFVPRGGPDGGDGGDGGDVILSVNPSLHTLLDLSQRKRYAAGRGGHGKGKNMYGKRGDPVVIQVPPGTLVLDGETGERLVDLTVSGETYVAVKGGRGGKGNAKFATARMQTPDFAVQGEAGQSRTLRLELKLIADVGLVGLPNAGKSTLLSKITAARPKIADYPFTTLVPQLGIVRAGSYRSFVMADIPGLIEGAHAGKGLGDRFLRHIERTRLLLLLIEAGQENRDEVYDVLLSELRGFNAEILEKPRLVAWTKIDLLSEAQQHGLPRTIRNSACFPISALTGQGLPELIQALSQKVFHHETPRNP
ncbi:GTPase ObgE [bacterium]|nr:GTPase ObgE [bacterium]